MQLLHIASVDLKVPHLNINCFRNKADEFPALISDLNLDLNALSETKLGPSLPDSFNTPAGLKSTSGRIVTVNKV